LFFNGALLTVQSLDVYNIPGIIGQLCVNDELEMQKSRRGLF